MRPAALTNEHDDPVTGAPADGGEGHYTSLSRQLDVVREMLRALETLTLPGQRHTMAKLVCVIDELATRYDAAISARNRGVLEQSLELLTRESQRIMPDVRSFSSYGEALIGLLAAVSARAGIRRRARRSRGIDHPAPAPSTDDDESPP